MGAEGTEERAQILAMSGEMDFERSTEDGHE